MQYIPFTILTVDKNRCWSLTFYFTCFNEFKQSLCFRLIHYQNYRLKWLYSIKTHNPQNYTNTSVFFLIFKILSSIITISWQSRSIWENSSGLPHMSHLTALILILSLVIVTQTTHTLRNHQFIKLSFLILLPLLHTCSNIICLRTILTFKLDNWHKLLNRKTDLSSLFLDSWSTYISSANSNEFRIRITGVNHIKEIKYWNKHISRTNYIRVQ